MSLAETSVAGPEISVRAGAPVAVAKAAASGSRADAAMKPGFSDLLADDEERGRERFVPVTRFAIIDRLTQPHSWPAGAAREARRFFRYLDYWRQQQYDVEVLELEQAYEPFNPDTDLLITRHVTPDDRRILKERVVAQMQRLLKQANYIRIDPGKVELILTKDSHYGLDFSVDLQAFDELLIYYRGASTRKDQRRLLRKFMRKQEFDVPVFQRLFVLFKIKPEDQRIREVMAEQKIDRKEAERHVQRMRSLIPGSVKSDNIHMKLFKNIPRADLEMIFPNTRVKFRLFDKIKLGVTAGSGLGLGAFSAAGKVALIFSNPIAAAGALFGLGGIALRQAFNFMNQRQRYMVVMAQNLYFHSMADNRGVMIKLADRAAEEDVKEEILLYSVLSKETTRRSDLKSVDAAIEQYLFNAFGVHVNFDIEDALERLMADGLVTEAPDGTLGALPPREAALHLDRKWDEFLDKLPDIGSHEGVEIEQGAAASSPATTVPAPPPA